MENGIIEGQDISLFKTTDISIGKAKKPNNDGRIAEFAVLSVQQIKKFMGRDLAQGEKVRVTIFDDQLGSALEVFKKFADTTKQDSHGGNIVNLPALMADDASLDQVFGYIYWPGGMVQEYRLRKGACYANDVDGNITKDKMGNPVVKETISVFCQVSHRMPADDGSGYKTVYTKGYGFEERGSELENRFYRNPVSAGQPAQQPSSMQGAAASSVVQNPQQGGGQAPAQGQAPAAGQAPF